MHPTLAQPRSDTDRSVVLLLPDLPPPLVVSSLRLKVFTSSLCVSPFCAFSCSCVAIPLTFRFSSGWAISWSPPFFVHLASFCGQADTSFKAGLVRPKAMRKDGSKSGRELAREIRAHLIAYFQARKHIQHGGGRQLHSVVARFEVSSDLLRA